MKRNRILLKIIFCLYCPEKKQNHRLFSFNVPHHFLKVQLFLNAFEFLNYTHFYLKLFGKILLFVCNLHKYFLPKNKMSLPQSKQGVYNSLNSCWDYPPSMLSFKNAIVTLTVDYMWNTNNVSFQLNFFRSLSNSTLRLVALLINLPIHSDDWKQLFTEKNEGKKIINSLTLP